ncbi:MAG: hypothetical protein K5851_00625 [Lachnospiraceae bacterium]|nr:hypothetical protein [Lachnospiraceae bacterium]
MLKFQHEPARRRTCQNCGRALPRSWTEPLCESCYDKELYREVKYYILENNVTEFEVADHFNIPLEKVRHWIKEGYIEYKSKNPFDF